MGPRNDLSFCACKTAWLAPETLVSMGASLHVWFLDAKQRPMDRNNKSLWVPVITCRFVRAKQRDLHQNNKSIWVPVLICYFCIKNSAFWTRISSLYGSQPLSVVFALKTAHFGPEFQVSMGPSPHLWFLYAKQRILDQNYKSVWVPDLICGFVLAKQLL